MKHFILQKVNNSIIKKTVKDWAREPENQKKFPKYSFNKPYSTDTTPTSEEIDAQLLREGYKRDFFFGDYYCFDPIDINKNDLIEINKKINNNSTNILQNIVDNTKKAEVINVQSFDNVNNTKSLNLIENIKNYIENNSVPLFKTNPNNSLSAIFDKKGFFFSDIAQERYKEIKDEPHIYIAYIKNQNGTTYIGKSFQTGGRWKRSHAYHLGTLAHHLNKTIRYDDQNHSHWIDAWMNKNTIKQNGLINTIELKSQVLIVFMPFDQYYKINFRHISPIEIKKINHNVESQLIIDYSIRNIGLLNVQGK